MNKLIKLRYWFAAAILSCLLLLLLGGAIAALDQLVRVPFYFTLPMAALVVNASAVLWRWRRNGWPLTVGSAIRKAATSLKFGKAPAMSQQSHRVEVSTQPANADSPHSNSPSLSKIAEAVATIHSVAWWLPHEHLSEAIQMERKADTSEAH
jgi:hypothetical protein